MTIYRDHGAIIDIYNQSYTNATILHRIVNQIRDEYQATIGRQVVLKDNSYPPDMYADIRMFGGLEALSMSIWWEQKHLFTLRNLNIDQFIVLANIIEVSPDVYANVTSTKLDDERLLHGSPTRVDTAFLITPHTQLHIDRFFKKFAIDEEISNEA